MSALFVQGFKAQELSDRVELTCSTCGEPMIFTPATTLGNIEEARLEHQAVCPKPEQVRRDHKERER